MSGSIAFDRAAEFYDATRSLDADVLAQVVRILGAELDGRGTCLEIGIGTGRMAVPLAESGYRMAGVDLAVPMLRKLLEKMRLPVAQADATALPFRPGAFGAGLACHVLHLIPAWQDVLRELVRVIRPGGVVLVDMGGPPSELFTELQRFIAAEAGVERPRVGASEPEAVDAAMGELGAGVRLLEPVRISAERTLSQWFERIEANLYSWTWSMPERDRLRACAAARPWAQERFGSLDAPRTIETSIVWRAYDL